MKKLLILLIASLAATSVSAQSLKFSPYLGIDYGTKFGASAQPMVGLDFSYELNMGLEFGFGTYLSRTNVASKNEEIRNNYFTDSAKHVRETPVYLFLKYNYSINEDQAITPYARVGQLRTSVYNNYENKVLADGKSFSRDDTIFYGNNFYSFGLAYSYKNYYIAAEYKVRMLEQEYLHAVYNFDSNTGGYLGYVNFTDRTYKANSVSFLIGYSFNTKNRSQIHSERRSVESEKIED
ncbi:MAG: hypothetical protein LBQ34_03640 [Alphaproteobacteria bacterium]|jgi:hypothetical protein|nr:hypothetical protein [Alphaproteobacteria bacterium]